MNPGLEALWDEEIERRKVKNMNFDSIQKPKPSTCVSNIMPTASHIFYKKNLEQLLAKYAKEEGNASMSFYQVNEKMDTTLPIEKGDDTKEILSASSVDFHEKWTSLVDNKSQSEQTQLLDILCQLADEDDERMMDDDHLSTSHVDEDSILGSQHPATEATSTDGENSECDEDERQTLEMTQIFDYQDPSAGKILACVLNFAAPI